MMDDFTKRQTLTYALAFSNLYIANRDTLDWDDYEISESLAIDITDRLLSPYTPGAKHLVKEILAPYIHYYDHVKFHARNLNDVFDDDDFGYFMVCSMTHAGRGFWEFDDPCNQYLDEMMETYYPNDILIIGENDKFIICCGPYATTITIEKADT